MAIDYRLAPEHRFPAALDDCVTAFRWAAESGAQGGQIHSRLAIGGDSTGAGLAAAASALLRDAGGPRPVGQLLVCPVLAPRRLTGSRRSLAQGYFAETAVIERDLSDYCPDDIDRSDVRVSPLLAQTFAGLPRTVVHTAEFDPFRDEGRDYVKALLRSGVPAQEVQHDGMIHYFYALPRGHPIRNHRGEDDGREPARVASITQTPKLCGRTAWHVLGFGINCLLSRPKAGRPADKTSSSRGVHTVPVL